MFVHLTVEDRRRIVPTCLTIVKAATNLVNHPTHAARTDPDAPFVSGGAR